MKSIASKETDSTPIKRYVGIFACLLVAATMMFFDHLNEDPITVGEAREHTDPDSQSASSHYPAPDFSARDLEGNLAGLSNYKGDVILLNLWATWCAPCRVEMPYFETLYRRFRSEGLTILAVSIDKQMDGRVADFVEKYQLSFPVLIDDEGDVERLYPTLSIPATFVIDKSGMVIGRIDGMKNWKSEETFEAVEYLLKRSGLAASKI